MSGARVVATLGGSPRPVGVAGTGRVSEGVGIRPWRNVKKPRSAWPAVRVVSERRAAGIARDDLPAPTGQGRQCRTVVGVGAWGCGCLREGEWGERRPP